MTTQDDSPRVADNAAHPPDPKTGRTPCEPHEAFTLEPAPRDARDEDRWQALLWAPDGDDSFPTWEAAAEATHALVTSVELASARPDDEPTWLTRAVEMADRLSKGEDLGQASPAGMLWEIIDWYRRHTTSASARPQGGGAPPAGWKDCTASANAETLRACEHSDGRVAWLELHCLAPPDDSDVLAPRDVEAWLRDALAASRPQGGGAAWEALRRIVDNNGGEGPPAGGCEVSLTWDDEHRTYSCFISAGETDAGAEACTLEMAVGAAAQCEEGTHVLLGRTGEVVCRECRGEGCDECKDGVDAPYGWHDGYQPEAPRPPVGGEPSGRDVVRRVRSIIQDAANELPTDGDGNADEFILGLLDHLQGALDGVLAVTGEQARTLNGNDDDVCDVAAALADAAHAGGLSTPYFQRADAALGRVAARLAARTVSLPEGARWTDSVPCASVGLLAAAVYSDETDCIDVWVYVDADGLHIQATADRGHEVVDIDPRGARIDVVRAVLARAEGGSDE